MKLPKVYRRPVYDEILERAHEPRRFIQVLAGPRQVPQPAAPPYFRSATERLCRSVS